MLLRVVPMCMFGLCVLFVHRFVVFFVFFWGRYEFVRCIVSVFCLVVNMDFCLVYLVLHDYVALLCVRFVYAFCAIASFLVYVCLVCFLHRYVSSCS